MAVASQLAGLDDPLLRHSVAVLRAGQSESGAFIASPAFPVYRYAWLRDGAFCAVALDAVDETGAVHRFHDWVARSIEAHRPLFARAVEELGNGVAPPPEAMPPARYTLDGSLEKSDDDPWPNFQIDGYGLWLWAVEKHYRDSLRGPVELVARYLAAGWRVACFDCWEEFDGGEHASTRGAVIAGLDAAARMLADETFAVEADRIRAELVERFVVDGRFRRGPADDRLDGSLLWLAVPFGVLPPTDARIEATVDAIRTTLTGPRGGVYRYRGDTYYGGGEWPLLTSSLAWHDVTVGRRAAFESAHAWVRGQARPNGDLPEQASENVQTPEMFEPWRRRWGSVATPLLWSHAMYVLAEAAAADA